MENKNLEDINPTQFIKKASEIRSKKQQQELDEKLRIEQKAIQDKIDRKVRDQIRDSSEKRKIKSIEDVLKKGEKIRWDIAGEGVLKGFVNNKIVFEIKKGLTIYNLYIKNTDLLKENTKKGYKSCATNLQVIKKKSEELLR